ncbi:hypothetical protein EDB86DRAFT_3097635 [Lactarius hatsudake]|nr:hypothetical protein EDB86DRAFT_3097635 [Lactarius hatsudake]
MGDSLGESTSSLRTFSQTQPHFSPLLHRVSAPSRSSLTHQQEDMPTLPQGRLLVLSFSLILSCVVIGVSISLLFAPRPPDIDDYRYNYPNSDAWEDWGDFPIRDFGLPFDYDGIGFRVVPVLGLVASASNFLIVVSLLVAPIMNPKTIISVVAIEAPCIYFVSFLWLATGAYAEHSIQSGTNCFLVPVGPYCTEHKVLEGISFINWIQLMLYANTLMTVATICHVRKHRVWLCPVKELPRFSAPAITFGPRPDIGFDTPFMAKSNESTVPILGDSTQPEDSRASHQFRSRIAFPPHPPTRPRFPLSASSSSPLPSSDSSRLSNSHGDTGHRILTRGEPPTYSGPGSTYELISV